MPEIARKIVKGFMMFIVFLVIGSAVTAVIDKLIGMSYEDVSSFTAIAHRVLYMAWGGNLPQGPKAMSSMKNPKHY